MRTETQWFTRVLAMALVLACVFAVSATAFAMRPGQSATCLADFLVCRQEADGWLDACLYGCMQIDDPIQEARCELICGDGYAIVSGACYAEYLACLALGN